MLLHLRRTLLTVLYFVAAIDILYVGCLFDPGGYYSYLHFSCSYMILLCLVVANHVFDCVALAYSLWSVL